MKNSVIIYLLKILIINTTTKDKTFFSLSFHQNVQKRRADNFKNSTPIWADPRHGKIYILCVGGSGNGNILKQW